MKFVVDTWVLYRASEGKRSAIELLHNIYEKCHKICIDDKSKVLKEYRSVQGLFISRWLTLVSSRKIHKVRIRNTCRNILGHTKDMKFVYVCLNSSSANTIVSEDYHFMNNGDKLLRKGIRLLSLTDALVESKKQA